MIRSHIDTYCLFYFVYVCMHKRMHICMCMCAQIWVCTYVCEGPTLTLVVFFSCPVYQGGTSCWTQSLLIGQVSLTSLLGVTPVHVSSELEWAGLASQSAQCNPCLSPECCNYKQLLHLPDFHIGSGDPDSNPHALEASDWYTEPPPQSLVLSYGSAIYPGPGLHFCTLRIDRRNSAALCSLCP